MPADYPCPHPSKCGGARYHDQASKTYDRCLAITAKMAKGEKGTPRSAPPTPETSAAMRRALSAWGLADADPFIAETDSATYAYDSHEVSATVGALHDRPTILLKSADGNTYLQSFPYEKADGSGKGTFIVAFANEPLDGEPESDDEFRGKIDRLAGLGAFPLAVFHDPDRGVLVSDPVRYDEIPPELYVATPEERAAYVDERGLTPETFEENRSRVFGSKPWSAEDLAEQSGIEKKVREIQTEVMAAGQATTSHAEQEAWIAYLDPKRAEIEALLGRYRELEDEHAPSETPVRPEPRLEGGRLPGAKSLAAFLTSDDGRQWVAEHGGIDLFRSKRYARGPAGWDGDPYPDPYALGAK